MNTNTVLMIVIVVAVGVAMFVVTQYPKTIHAPAAAAAASLNFEQRWPPGAWRFQ